jgi:hypothetical protein
VLVSAFFTGWSIAAPLLHGPNIVALVLADRFAILRKPGEHHPRVLVSPEVSPDDVTRPAILLVTY